MGDLEVFLAVISVFSLGFLVYNILSILTYKNLLKRIGVLKISRKDFYECGFKPQTQKPIKVSIQFLLICIFFLLYDIELVFIFPYVSGVSYTGLYDTTLMFFFFSIFFVSLNVDYDKHALV